MRPTRRSRAHRHDLVRDGLAAAVAAPRPGNGQQRFHGRFCDLVIAARVAMYQSTWPSRSYLLMVSAKLALAWLVIRLMTSVIRNAFIVRLVSVSAWLVAALSIIGQLDPVIDALDLGLGGARRTAADAATA